MFFMGMYEWMIHVNNVLLHYAASLQAKLKKTRQIKWALWWVYGSRFRLYWSRLPSAVVVIFLEGATQVVKHRHLMQLIP